MPRTENALSELPPRVLTAPTPLLSELLRALQAVGDGDFSVRLPGEWTGLEGKVADAFNSIVTSNARVASDLGRVAMVVGKQGRARQRVQFGRLSGAWGEMETSVNTLIDDLFWPTTEVTRVLVAVARGDLSQAVRLDVDGRPLEGEFLRGATVVNSLIDQLGVFTSEVTRVAREVGVDGKLGGQADVRDVSGVWKELIVSVNSMASNLTAQVRNISEVTIAVARGDLSQKITVDVHGEILQLKEAINTMVDQLRSFASEVTRVAQEVGTDGKLGGQAQVLGVAGTWKDFTDTVIEKQRMLERLHRADEDLVGKVVLVVDDDPRNLFALSSVLERRGINVLTASTGHEAIERLGNTPGISMVLMDTMMPGIDGYQTMQAIREKPEFRRLPIVALTAKAMRADRDRCIQAGASDYLAKPVNAEQLLSVLRVWLQDRRGRHGLLGARGSSQDTLGRPLTVETTGV